MSQNLYIQGDKENEWFSAQDWQKDFLRDDSFIKPAFTRHRNYSYMKHEIVDITKDLALDDAVKTSFEASNISEISKFTLQTSWVPAFMTWSSVGSNVSRVGVLVNLTTGIFRFYIVSSDATLSFTHKGCTSISDESLVKFRDQYENDYLIPSLY